MIPGCCARAALSTDSGRAFGCLRCRKWVAGSIEVVQRYAHLAPNHLTEHARKVDFLLRENDTNTTQGDNQVGLKLA